MVFLILHTVAELRSIRGGKYLQESNSEFYFSIMQGTRLEDLDSNFEGYRIRMVSSGDNNILDAKRFNDITEQLNNIPAAGRKQFDETLRSVIEHIDYGIYYLRRLAPATLIKMVYLLSQIEGKNGNKLERLQFTAVSQQTDRPAQMTDAILERYSFEDLTKGSTKFNEIMDALWITVNQEKHMIHCDNARIDFAMIGPAHAEDNGGIDLNQINVLRHGKTVNVQFDQAQLNALEQGDFEGFTPVIINMQPISSPFQLLGIKIPPKQEVQLAKA